MRSTKLNKAKKKNHETIFYCTKCKETKQQADKNEWILHNWPKFGLEKRICRNCNNI